MCIDRREKMNRTKKTKPWQDEFGNSLPDSKLEEGPCNYLKIYKNQSRLGSVCIDRREKVSRTKKTKPWQDEFGNLLPDSKLKEVSKNWSLKNWEEFQKKGMGTSSWVGDLLENGQDIEELFSEQNSVWDLVGSETFSGRKGKIPDLKRYVQRLNDKEYKVLKYYFADSMTDREIAGLLKENYKTVQNRRLAAIKKLRSFFAEEEAPNANAS